MMVRAVAPGARLVAPRRRLAATATSDRDGPVRGRVRLGGRGVGKSHARRTGRHARHATMRAMSESVNTRTARWLLAFFVLLILYGSLFPFELRQVPVDGPLDVVRRLRWGISTRGDIFANVLLYLPFGATLAWALPQSRSVAGRLLVATLCGTALSFFVEATQVFLVRRVATYADVVNNTIGTFLGAAAALLVRAATDRLNASETFRLTREPVAAALVALWLATFLPSWLPPFDTSRWPEHWARLFEQGMPAWTAVAVEALGWLVVGAALRALTRPQYVYPLLLACMAVALTVQFTLFVNSARFDEPGGAVLALLLWPAANRLDDRTQLGALFALLVVATLARGLEPFQFAPHAQPFNLVPFADLISRGSTGFNLPLLFGKAFWHGALVWVLVRRGSAPLAAGLVIAALLLALEFAQAWTPAGQHVPSVTDPLVAIAAGIVMALIASGGGASVAASAPARRRS
jgi:VanZ family protein